MSASENSEQLARDGDGEGRRRNWISRHANARAIFEWPRGASNCARVRRLFLNAPESALPSPLQSVHAGGPLQLSPLRAIMFAGSVSVSPRSSSSTTRAAPTDRGWRDRAQRRIGQARSCPLRGGNKWRMKTSNFVAGAAKFHNKPSQTRRRRRRDGRPMVDPAPAAPGELLVAESDEPKRKPSSNKSQLLFLTFSSAI